MLLVMFLNAEAVLAFEEGVITEVALNLKAKIADIAAQEFIELTNEAKDNCPISRVLNCKISVEAALL